LTLPEATLLLPPAKENVGAGFIPAWFFPNAYSEMLRVIGEAAWNPGKEFHAAP
jgi:hypothetical protein